MEPNLNTPSRDVERRQVQVAVRERDPQLIEAVLIVGELLGKLRQSGVVAAHGAKCPGKAIRPSQRRERQVAGVRLDRLGQHVEKRVALVGEDLYACSSSRLVAFLSTARQWTTVTLPQPP